MLACGHSLSGLIATAQDIEIKQNSATLDKKQARATEIWR